ncbi:MAG: hypothetical protein PUP90_25630 [Nostoc sp. S4]|nr:hypothetical protein [Nostoc sp. S4]
MGNEPKDEGAGGELLLTPNQKRQETSLAFAPDSALAQRPLMQPLLEKKADSTPNF